LDYLKFLPNHRLASDRLSANETTVAMTLPANTIKNPTINRRRNAPTAGSRLEAEEYYNLRKATGSNRGPRAQAHQHALHCLNDSTTGKAREREDRATAIPNAAACNKATGGFLDLEILRAPRLRRIPLARLKPEDARHTRTSTY